MKLKLLDYLGVNEPTLIASFGQAQIVRHLDGRCELRDGTPDDHTAAREWASMFMHGAIPSPGSIRSNQAGRQTQSPPVR